ncbi:MAG: HAD hydrolase-like protein [Clostridia bacterium]|nr:HAD hydrolase-like protein [Clostridia bacterium]
MNHIKLVLFDFDGTVIDNSEGIFNCIRYSLNRLGLPVPGEAVLRRFVGPSLFDSFRSYIEDDEEKAERFVATYRERYAPVGFTECRLYDGMEALLRRLKAQGFYVAVCSGKPYDFVVKIAKMQGLYDVFDGYFCPGFAPVDSDKAGLILAAVERFGVAKEEALMVGDRRFDIEAAKKAGVASLGVRYGFAEPGELETAGADKIVASVDDIDKILTNISGKTP